MTKELQKNNKASSDDVNIKEEVIKLIKDLPDDTTIEDIQYHLFVKEKLLKAEAQLREGKTIPHKEVMEKARKKWLK